MTGLSTSDPDARISGVAAIAALGGHAAIIVVGLLLAWRAPPVMIAPTVVGVTLVGGGAPGQASAAPALAAAPSSASASRTSSQERVLSGDGLDGLTAPTSAAASTPSAPASASPSTTAASASAGQGSSRAGQGLGQGEGVEGIDLYAAASLPMVGTRPAAPPPGDLWERVAPCWRRASSRPATLMVEIRADGALAGSPQAVRRAAAPADPQTLLAERAAARALQACAPYSGLEARQWRVVFPG
jgi:hypothetical protein